MHLIAQDPSQFASQVVGRLLPLETQPGVKQFLNALSHYASYPWLRPLSPTLTAPAAEFARILAGHSAPVYGVAVSGDGRLAVSASDDATLKVWDTETGRELRTLRGHATSVYRLALSEDGRIAVSASDDKTLKVWDVESGRELRTIEGHGVALSGDGRLAVSESHDHT